MIENESANSRNINECDSCLLNEKVPLNNFTHPTINRSGMIMGKGKTFKVCSTCINFTIEKQSGQNKFYCTRLGYETKPHYSFNCWDPKPKVKQLMERLERQDNER